VGAGEKAQHLEKQKRAEKAKQKNPVGVTRTSTKPNKKIRVRKGVRIRVGNTLLCQQCWCITYHCDRLLAKHLFRHWTSLFGNLI